MSRALVPCAESTNWDLSVQSNAELAGMITRHNQEQLLESIRTETRQTLSEIAESLGVSADEATDALSGEIDLTLTEMRLLAIASEVTISFDVRPVFQHFKSLLAQIQSLSTGNEALHAHSEQTPREELVSIWLERLPTQSKSR